MDKPVMPSGHSPKRNPWRVCAELCRRLLAHKGGGLTTWFAIGLVPMMFFAGAGIDMARSINQQSEMQSAVDAAALAGGSAFVSAATASTATTIATNYMNSFKTSSGLTSLTFTVTPTTITSGASVALYKVVVTATATINNTLMAMAKASNTIGVTATAQNPVYNVTIALSSFNSSAADLNTISYYIVPQDGSAPAISATTQIYSNAASSNPASVTIQVTASQKIGFLLTNTTGGMTRSVCTTVLFWTTCKTVSSGYGYNQYGGSQGSVHYFYSHMFPPSKLAYPTVSQNCSLQVLTTSAPTSFLTCFSSTPPNAAVNCVQLSGQKLYFNWNDMGGTVDDKDYNDAVYTVACSKVDTTVTKGLVLTN